MSSSDSAQQDSPIPDKPEVRVLKVSAGSDCHRLGTAIASRVEEGTPAVVEFIGAGACNQAIKGVIIANSLLASQGKIIHILPSFHHRKLWDNPNAVAVQFRVIPIEL